MQILFYFVVVLHVIVSLFLIGVVLLQQGRSADLAGAFGGQGSQTAFGPRAAANVLTRLTTWSADHLHAHVALADDPVRSLRQIALRPRRRQARIAISSGKASEIGSAVPQASRQAFPVCLFCFPAIIHSSALQ